MKQVKPLIIEIQATAFLLAGRQDPRGIAPVCYCHSPCQAIKDLTLQLDLFKPTFQEQFSLG